MDVPDKDGLLPHHRKQLEQSCIPPKIWRKRGYRSIVDPAELRTMGFREHQIRVPCLYIPAHGIHGEIVHQIRPDAPRIGPDGKLVKYDRVPGSPNILDINPIITKAMLQDTSLELVITEGSKKADSGLAEGILVVSLMGVWNFKTKGKGGSLVISDLDSIAWQGRRVYIGYDSDAITKPAVYQAEIELAAELTTRGALPFFLQIPDLQDGSKAGIDDHRSEGGTLADLVKQAKPEPLTPAGLMQRQNVHDFYAYLPNHTYIFLPTGDFWLKESVSASCSPVPVGGGLSSKPTIWLDQRRSVQQITWAPGEPRIIEGKLLNEDGWVEKDGANAYNTYKPPLDWEGDPAQAQRWLDHVFMVYPDDAEHILDWLAHRVQRPWEKLNHALMLGGAQGIGKDTVLAPAVKGIGQGNFADISPAQALGRFNPWLRSVILRISEVKDTGGDSTRFNLYEHMKTLIAAPPDTLLCDEKNKPETRVPNLLGVVYTTNNRTNGIYLEADDRRHYVTWSQMQREAIPVDYFSKMYDWLDADGYGHCVAWLRARDLSGFNPKAPPKQTEAFWDVVDAMASPEDSEMDSVLSLMGYPEAVTIAMIITAANANLSKGEILIGADSDFGSWLRDRKNRSSIKHRFEKAGYTQTRNPYHQDGRWKVGGENVVIYAKSELGRRGQAKAAEVLVKRMADKITSNGHKPGTKEEKG